MPEQQMVTIKKAGIEDPIRPAECPSKTHCFLQDCAQRSAHGSKGLILQDIYNIKEFAFLRRRFVYQISGKKNDPAYQVHYCPACGIDLSGYCGEVAND